MGTGPDMTTTDPAHRRPTDEDPTLGALVHDLSEQTSALVRSEVELAKAELAQKGKDAGIGIGLFSVAGLLGFFGGAVLIATAILAARPGAPGLGLRADHRRRCSSPPPVSRR